VRGALLVVLISGSSSQATGVHPRHSETEEAPRAQSLVRAADPKNPWALAHGITAFGPSFLASDFTRSRTWTN
jgi:hypothetical protein